MRNMKTCSYILALALCASCASLRLECVILDYNLSFYEPRVLQLLSMLASRHLLCCSPERGQEELGSLNLQMTPGEKRKCVRQRTQRKCENILFIIPLNSHEYRRNQGERSSSNIFARI